MTWLRLLLFVPDYRPFVERYLLSGDYTPLLALCDLIEERGDVAYVDLARTLRACYTG